MIEKKSYPLHRVCGEYISNEALPFLKRENLFPEKFSPPQIDQLLLSAVNGRASTLKLGMGGFGISRFTFDNFLFETAKHAGVDVMLETEANSVTFKENRFYVDTENETLEADVVVGAFGKRSKLDVVLKRSFIQKRSPFVGVKYHVRTDNPTNQIALHNFQGGYCGINSVENGISNICYLSERENLKKFGSIEVMEENILHRNPHLKYLFANSDFLLQKPEVINEISFETKLPVENHILMAGDSAGMIAPLCGNGMAIAVHSAKIAVDVISDFFAAKISRAEMERRYARAWQESFSKRLWLGRKIQLLFGNATLSRAAVNLVLHSRPIANFLVQKTHGQPF